MIRFSRVTFVAASIAIGLCAAAPALLAETPRTLTIGLSQEPDTLHPIITTMSASGSVRVMALRPLAAVNEVWKWECWLCTEIPTLENGGAKFVEENGKKKVLVTWEIRGDAVWGDGKPVIGDDLALAWKIGVTPTITKGGSEGFDGIESVTVDPANPKRVTFKWKEARYDYNQVDWTFVPLPSHIEGPIFEKTKGQTGAYERQTSYVTDPTNPGLYNGPYKVKEIKPASHVLLERNAKFAGKAAAFEQVLFKIIPNTQALEANLIAKSVHMSGGTGITFDQALAFRKRAAKDASLQHLRVATMDDLIYEHIDFNLRDPLVADVRVRRALFHALDRGSISKALFDGIQKPAAHAFHPMSPYFTDEGAGAGALGFDRAKAAALLDAAGWKLGKDGVRTKDGRLLALTIKSTAQNKVRELIQVMLQESWRAVGVSLAIRNEPARVFFGETLKRAEFGQLGMYASTLASPDDIQLDTFHSSHVPTAANGYVGSNYSAWSNPKVDQALAEAQVTLDPAARAALVKTAIKEIVTDLPQLPLFYRVAVSIVPTALKVNQLGGVDYPTGLRVERWTWDDSAPAH